VCVSAAGLRCVCVYLSLGGRGHGQIQVRGHFLFFSFSESVTRLKLTVSCCWNTEIMKSWNHADVNHCGSTHYHYSHEERIV